MAMQLWQAQMNDLLEKILEAEKIKWIPNITGKVLWPRQSNEDVLRFFDLIITREDGSNCIVALSLRGGVVPNLQERLRCMLRTANDEAGTSLEILV
jgi:hypothetical protein